MLKRGEVVLGTFVRTTSPPVVEVLGLSGFDFIIIDNEHSPLGIESTANQIRTADLMDIVPIVRVTENRQSLILRALDAGALGVQVPQISSMEEARLAAESAKYAPLGVRGLATSHRAAKYGFMDDETYWEAANQETMVVAYVENREAYEELDNILTVPGIDVFMIGPMDLSQALGHPTHPEHPEVQQAIEEIIKKVRGAGRAVGITAATPEAAKGWIEKGVQYIAYSSDLGLLARISSQSLRDIHQSLAGE